MSREPFQWARDREAEEWTPSAEEDPPGVDDPTRDVREWALTDRERRIFEAGFMVGWGERQFEVDDLNYEADRLYRAAFDHRDCSCWRRRQHGFPNV